MVTWGWLGRRGQWGSSSCQRKCLNWVLKEERPGKLVTKSNLSVASVQPSECLPLRAQPVLPLKGGAAPRPPSHLPLGWGSRIEGKLSPACHPPTPPPSPPIHSPFPRAPCSHRRRRLWGAGSRPLCAPLGPSLPRASLGPSPCSPASLSMPLIAECPCGAGGSGATSPGTLTFEDRDVDGGPHVGQSHPLIPVAHAGVWACGLGAAGGQGGQLQCIHSQQGGPRPGQAPAGSISRSRRAEAGSGGQDGRKRMGEENGEWRGDTPAEPPLPQQPNCAPLCGGDCAGGTRELPG